MGTAATDSYGAITWAGHLWRRPAGWPYQPSSDGWPGNTMGEEQCLQYVGSADSSRKISGFPW